MSNPRDSRAFLCAFAVRYPLNAVACLKSHSVFFFFNDTATTEIYTLSLHDALPIFLKKGAQVMFVKNDLNFEKRYYNGKIGFVSFVSADEIEVFLPEEGIKIEVEKYEWQ